MAVLALSVCLVLLTGAAALHAQSAGSTLDGTIVDGQGNGIINATLSP